MQITTGTSLFKNSIRHDLTFKTTTKPTDLKTLATILLLTTFMLCHAKEWHPTSPTSKVQPKITVTRRFTPQMEDLLRLFGVTDCLGSRIELELPSDGYGWYSQGTNPAGSFYYPINPTDTFVLKMNGANPSWRYSYASFEGYNGQSHSCPIVIMNLENTQTIMGAGISLESCTHFKITGRYTTDTDTSHTATPTDNYGLYVVNPAEDINGVAIAIQGKSRDVFVERIKVYRKTYGFWAKTDPRCDTSYNWNGSWSFHMDSVTIIQCYFKNIGQDVGYAGNTAPTGGRTIFCGGIPYDYYPMRLSNCDLAYCLVDSANRTGFQLSGCDQGYNQIRYNILKNLGYEYNQQQGDGIAIGGMTANCHVFGNQTSCTFLYGILDFGCGINYIEQNTFDSVGYLKWNDPYADLDSFAAANGMTASGGYLINTYSAPSNTISSTKLTIPQTNKTSIIRDNILGINATSDPDQQLGVVLWANFSIYPGEWNTDNICCNNVQTSGRPAEIVRFTYDPGSGTVAWPVMIFVCNRYKQFIYLKQFRKKSRGRPYNL